MVNLLNSLFDQAPMILRYYTIAPNFKFKFFHNSLSSLMWLDSYYVVIAFSTHKYFTDRVKYLPYPSPHFTFRALKMSFYVLKHNVSCVLKTNFERRSCNTRLLSSKNPRKIRTKFLRHFWSRGDFWSRAINGPSVISSSHFFRFNKI